MCTCALPQVLLRTGLASVLAGAMAVCVMCVGTGGCVGVESTEEYPNDENTNIHLIEFCNLAALSCPLNQKMWFFNLN